MDLSSYYVVLTPLLEELGNRVVKSPVHWLVIVSRVKESRNSVNRSYLNIPSLLKLAVKEGL